MPGYSPLSLRATPRKRYTRQTGLHIFAALLLFSLLSNYFFGSPNDTDIKMPAMRIIVTAPTFYPNEQDIRLGIALDLCREAAKHELLLILVDASPSEAIRQKLVEAGRGKNGVEYVKVVPQTYEGKKGAALREGIHAAHQELQEGETGMIAFQEPEKVRMVSQWRNVEETLANQAADVCVPRRSDASFQESYPIEQYHSEQFANLYLDSLGKAVGFPSVDWTMGPIAFKSTFVQSWLDYPGELWDMQLVPMIRAQRWHGAKVVSYEFDYYQPDSMKAEEEGVPKWSEKRLFQLNHLFDLVGGALKEDKEGSQATQK